MSVQGMRMTQPDGWQDKSMLILSSDRAGQSGVVPNMVVTRDRLPTDLPGEPRLRMDTLIDRQVAQMETQLARFAIVSRRVDDGDNRATGELKVDWESAQAALTQGLTFVDAGDGVLMIATATAGRGEYGEHEATFREMLQSFRTG